MNHLPPRLKPKERRVLGHTCRGLVAHFEAAAYPSVPFFAPSGALTSLEDVNAVVIRYCPYCGERLAPVVD